MPQFSYRARDSHGNLIEEVIDAPALTVVEDKLRKLDYIPLEIKEQQEARKRAPLFKRRVKLQDLALMFRQMATMVDAGLPIIATLEIVRKQSTNLQLAQALEHTKYRVEAGSSLSEALTDFPEIFTSLHCQMIRVAEEAGLLGVILNRLAEIVEHEQETRERIKSATRYPKIVVGALVTAFVILMTFVVPKFANMYARFNVELPLPTRIMVGLNHVFQEYWWALILTAAFLFVGFKTILRTEQGRFRWDTMRLRVYIFGDLMLKIAMSRFSRLLSMMVKSGVPIIQTLENVAGTMDNVVLEQTVHLIRNAIMEGKSLAEPMEVSRYFPDMVVNMVAVGEQTGQLDDLLAKVADYYDREVDYTIRNLSAMLEPVLLLVLAVVVLFFALAIFLPMWNLMSLFRS